MLQSLPFYSLVPLGWASLLLSHTLILIALLCLSCKIWRTFVSLFFTRLWRVSFIFIFAQLPACVVCIALPVGLAVVLTWGFYFAFAVFLFVFRKQICFSSEGVTKDKLVFGMLKHGHVSFQILT